MSHLCHLILNASSPKSNSNRVLSSDKSIATQGMFDLCKIANIQLPIQPPAPVTTIGASN